MASQNFNLEVRYSNGIPKLYVDVTDKFNVTVNKFSYNNVVYIHIYRKGKTLSLPFEDLEELVGLIPTIKGKLSLLETPRQQTHQAPQDIDLNRQTQQQQLQLSQQPQQLQTQQQQLQLSQQPQQVQPQQHLQLSQQPQQVQPQQHLQLSQQPPQFITFYEDI